MPRFRSPTPNIGDSAFRFKVIPPVYLVRLSDSFAWGNHPQSYAFMLLGAPDVTPLPLQPHGLDDAIGDRGPKHA